MLGNTWEGVVTPLPGSRTFLVSADMLQSYQCCSSLRGGTRHLGGFGGDDMLVKESLLRTTNSVVVMCRLSTSSWISALSWRLVSRKCFSMWSSLSWGLFCAHAYIVHHYCDSEKWEQKTDVPEMGTIENNALLLSKKMRWMCRWRQVEFAWHGQCVLCSKYPVALSLQHRWQLCEFNSI